MNDTTTIDGTRVTIAVNLTSHPASHLTTDAGDQLLQFASAFGDAEIVSEEPIDIEATDDEE